MHAQVPSGGRGVEHREAACERRMVIELEGGVVGCDEARIGQHAQPREHVQDRRTAVPTLREGVKQKAWFCGTPAQVIDGIKSIEAKYPGLEDFMIHWAEGLPPDEFIEQLQWFAREVMPAFNRG